MRINFTKLTAKNFRSLQNIDVNLNHNTVKQIVGMNLDEGGSNGSGKSNLLLAFCWCLYGETFPKLQADAVLNDKLKKNCEVSVEFQRDNKTYKIIRYRNHDEYHNKLRIFENGVDISFHKVNQDFLNSLLGLNFKLFHFCNIFQLERASLFRMTESKRKMFFEEFIKDIKFFRVFCYDKVKEEIKDLEEQAEALKTDKKVVANTLFMLQESLNGKKDRLSILKNELKADFDKLASEEKKLHNKLEAVKIEMKKLKQAINNDKIKALYAEMAELEKNIKEQTHDKMKLEFEINRQEDKLEHIREEIDNITKDLSRYSKGVCPVCFTNLKEHKSKKLIKHIDKLKTMLKDLKNKMSEIILNAAEMNEKYEKLCKIISSDKDAIQQKENELKAAETEIVNLKVKFDDYNYLKVKIKTELDLIKDRKELLEEKKTEIKKLFHEIKELNNKIKITEDKEKEMQNSIEKIQDKLEYLSILKQMFRIALPNELITTFMDTFEYHINKFLNEMEFQAFNVVMQPEKNQDGEITKIPIYVMRHDGIAKKFEELSGGEQQRLILAEILAIKHIVEELLDVSYNILWMDEILDISLDSAGSEKIRNMLNEIVKNNDYSIELISHSQDLLFENKLIVKKENGWSYLS